jgi:hypothetical protein
LMKQISRERGLFLLIGAGIFGWLLITTHWSEEICGYLPHEQPMSDHSLNSRHPWSLNICWCKCISERMILPLVCASIYRNHKFVIVQQVKGVCHNQHGSNIVIGKGLLEYQGVCCIKADIVLVIYSTHITVSALISWESQEQRRIIEIRIIYNSW